MNKIKNIVIVPMSPVQENIIVVYVCTIIEKIMSFLPVILMPVMKEPMIDQWKILLKCVKRKVISDDDT